MQNLPQHLCPTGAFEIELQPGRHVALPLCHPKFNRWVGSPPTFTYGGKPVLEYEGKALFPELVILHLLQERGWDGVWVSSYGGVKFLRDMPQDASLSNAIILPPERRVLFDRIQAAGESKGGCFDVMAWYDDLVLFLEAKRHGHDKLRVSQRRWINGALSIGLATDALMIVEWESRDRSAVKLTATRHGPPDNGVTVGPFLS